MALRPTANKLLYKVPQNKERSALYVLQLRHGAGAAATLRQWPARSAVLPPLLSMEGQQLAHRDAMRVLPGQPLACSGRHVAATLLARRAP